MNQWRNYNDHITDVHTLISEKKIARFKLSLPFTKMSHSLHEYILKANFVNDWKKLANRFLLWGCYFKVLNPNRQAKEYGLWRQTTSETRIGF